MKDPDELGYWPPIDDVIVELHTEGENVWQAFARATQIDGVNPDARALFAELWETGHVLLASGDTHPLPRLDAKGVAEICTFELGAADYEADRILLEDPAPAEPRMPAEALWPALRRNGYKTGPNPTRPNLDYTPLARLAESTGIPLSTIRRIATNATTTVGVETAFKLLMELDDERARELEADVLVPWHDQREEFDRQGLALEYIDALTRFAQQARGLTPLTDDERQALEDTIWISFAAQHKSFLGTTAAERIADTLETFRTAHGREPTRLSRRLRHQARRFLEGEEALAEKRSRSLRLGVHRGGTSLTVAAVNMRTHRLRKAGRLPAKSQPKSYTPPRPSEG